MSLLDEYMEECIILDRTTKSDGRGGIIYSYTDGAPFKAAFYLANSLEQDIAEKQGVTGVYQITIDKSVRLDYHTAFKRLRDGKTFRVTSKDDRHTPASSSLDKRSVNAEEYVLPADEGLDG